MTIVKKWNFRKFNFMKFNSNLTYLNMQNHKYLIQISNKISKCLIHKKFTINKEIN